VLKRRTTSPAAANPNTPVTNVAVPKPLAQSSVKSLPGSGVAQAVPSDHGKYGFSG
jgi:hypothetical protein